MSKLAAVALVTFFLAFSSGGARAQASDPQAQGQAEKPGASNPEALGRHLAESLSKGAYEQVLSGATAELRSALPAPKLAQAWEDLVKSNGAFQSTAPITKAQKDGLDIAVVRLQFEKADVQMTAAFRGTALAGIFFKPLPAESPKP